MLMANAAIRWLMTRQDEPFVLTEFDPFSPARDEVVVEIAGCGVCHTDLGYYYDGVRTKHALPLTLGHEISGRVVEAGPEGWRARRGRGAARGSARRSSFRPSSRAANATRAGAARRPFAPTRRCLATT